MSFTEILAVIDERNVSDVVLLCHHNSDPDAVCSAFAFKKLLEKVRPFLSVEIGTGHGVSKLAKHLLNFLPININMKPNLDKSDLIILLDTNTIKQLDGLAEKVAKASVPVIVIDHHSAHPTTQAISTLCITNEDASSTCDIVFSFYKQINVKPEADVAKALFLGIAFDTRHFVLANSSTFKAVAELVDSGVNAQETLSMLSLPMDFSERVARMKACRRAKLLKVGEWIIALSYVSAFQASAARSLTDLGAHVAAVAGQKNENIEISLRCTRDFASKTGMHLGRDIAKPLGEYLKGMGGGHAMAAGINGIGDVEVGLKRCFRLLKKNLTKNE